MKSTKSGPAARNTFTIVNTGIECVFFTKTTKPVVPTELVTKICEDALACGDVMKRRTKYINRLTPVSGMEKATENGLIRVARAVMAPYFNLVDDEVPAEIENNSTATEDTKPSEKEADKPRFTVRRQASLGLVLLRCSPNPPSLRL
jgi:tRNA acetyltransferase TAN1